VTQGRKNLFGEILAGDMVLNEIGAMIQQFWLELTNRFTNIELDEFVIMPNHCHAIIIIHQPVGATLVVAPNDNHSNADQAGTSPAPTCTDHDDAHNVHQTVLNPAPTLGDIVGAFKSISTHAYILGVRQKGWSPFQKHLWQRNYYEHILRNETDLEQTRQYIQNNPIRWGLDEENADPL
jgi:putative transposase